MLRVVFCASSRFLFLLKWDLNQNEPQFTHYAPRNIYWHLSLKTHFNTHVFYDFYSKGRGRSTAHVSSVPDCHARSLTLCAYRPPTAARFAQVFSLICFLISSAYIFSCLFPFIVISSLHRQTAHFEMPHLADYLYWRRDFPFHQWHSASILIQLRHITKPQ